jgi:hypothetical protein
MHINDSVDYRKNSLMFWKENKNNFKYLSIIAKSIFCVQASSCASEMVFSAGGLLQTTIRNKLSDKHLEQLLFLRWKNK